MHQPVTPAEPVLLLADRCDRCGAQAFVRVTVKTTDALSFHVPRVLDFCGHHYAKHELALLAVATNVVDERWRINGAPSPSATV